MNYLLGKTPIPENTRAIHRDSSQPESSIDLNVSAEDYGKMIEFVDVSVDNMTGAALQIRHCSQSSIKTVVGDYIQKVMISSFREYDKESADNEFVEAVYKAIMLNMQGQVIAALESSHTPSNNAEKELQYKNELELVKDYDSFEEIVTEVLRQKYVEITSQDIAFEEFKDVYKVIFRSWALDDPALLNALPENVQRISLEELTAATINTATNRANAFVYNSSLSKPETTFLIAFGSVLGAAIVGSIAVTIVMKSKKRRVK